MGCGEGADDPPGFVKDGAFLEVFQEIISWFSFLGDTYFGPFLRWAFLGIMFYFF